VPDETTDMNAFIRRAAFGMTEEQMDEAMEERKKPQPMKGGWLQQLYLKSKGIEVPYDDATKEGENNASE